MYAHISQSSWILPQRPLGRPALVSITPLWPPKTVSVCTCGQGGLQTLRIRNTYSGQGQLPPHPLCCSVAQSCPTLPPHGLQHTRPLCPSRTPRIYSNSCPLSRWSHPTISSSVVPFSHHRSLPASGSFQMSQFFELGGQSIGVSAAASVLPMNI